MKSKPRFSTEFFRRLKTPAKCSDFFFHLDDLKPGPVVLYGRESDRSQEKNLIAQLSNLEIELKERGFVVVASFSEIVPGWAEVFDERGRPAFERAILKARDLGGVVVAESVYRFRRHYVRDWEKRRKQPPLNLFDIDTLRDETNGVLLVTVVHPDAPYSKVLSYQTKRGQTGKGNFGGRPKEEFPIKARREKLLPRAVDLWESGRSYREIGKELKVASRTIWDWIKGWKKSAHPKPNSK